MSLIFDTTTPKMLSAQWVVHYCLNKFSENKNIPAAINAVLEKGQIECDGNWGIHRWNKRKAQDHGVARFDGYRLFIGPEEHGLPEYEKFIEAYISELDLKRYLLALVENSPAISNKSEIQELIGQKRAPSRTNDDLIEESARTSKLQENQENIEANTTINEAVDTDDLLTNTDQEETVDDTDK